MNELHTSDHEIETTLALLRGVEPRPGLEMRTLARLESSSLAAPRSHFWTIRLFSAAAAFAAAAVVAVGLHVGIHDGETGHKAPASAFVPARLPAAPRGAIAASAAIAIAQREIHPALRARSHHGHGGRAEHSHVTLPPGTVAPPHPFLRAPHASADHP